MYTDATLYPHALIARLDNGTTFAATREGLIAAPDSSAIETAIWFAESRDMFLRFRGNNRIYDYLNVPFGEYWRLVSSESVGRYFNREMRGQYEFLVIDKEAGTITWKAA